MGVNNVTLVGNLTHDPEYKTTAKGVSILSFSIAVNDNKRLSNGEWESIPNYFDITYFGNKAMEYSLAMHKGMKVAIWGKLHWSQWERDGKKQSKVDVTANDIAVIQKVDSSAPTKEYEYADEDIPF